MQCAFSKLLQRCRMIEVLKLRIVPEFFTICNSISNLFRVGYKVVINRNFESQTNSKILILEEIGRDSN